MTFYFSRPKEEMKVEIVVSPNNDDSVTNSAAKRKNRQNSGSGSSTAESNSNPTSQSNSPKPDNLESSRFT